ncbi:MAG: hypothetical protein ACYCDV_07990 [Facklamia hominis]
MTKLEDLKVNIEEVKNEYLKQLEELKAKIEELYGSEDETDNRWKPNVGEECWRVSVGGDVYRLEWDNDKFDNNIFNHTDIFPTEEEAYLDKGRKQIRRELMKYGKDFESGGDNWTFNYNYRDKIIGYWNSKYSCHPFAIYFESKEIAEKAVEEVGADRIKKYLFGVK